MFAGHFLKKDYERAKINQTGSIAGGGSARAWRQCQGGSGTGAGGQRVGAPGQTQAQAGAAGLQARAPGRPKSPQRGQRAAGGGIGSREERPGFARAEGQTQQAGGEGKSRPGRAPAGFGEIARLGAQGRSKAWELGSRARAAKENFRASGFRSCNPKSRSQSAGDARARLRSGPGGC